MSTKHNTQHNRTAGGYKRRLRKRGLSRTPVMTPYWRYAPKDSDSKRFDKQPYHS